MHSFAPICTHFKFLHSFFGYYFSGPHIIRVISQLSKNDNSSTYRGVKSENESIAIKVSVCLIMFIEYVKSANCTAMQSYYILLIKYCCATVDFNHVQCEIIMGFLCDECNPSTTEITWCVGLDGMFILNALINIFQSW